MPEPAPDATAIGHVAPPLHADLSHYQGVLNSLANQISPEEVNQAEQLFQQSRRWFWVVVGIWFFCQCLNLFITPYFSPFVQSVFSDILIATTAGMVLFLCSAKGILFSGRMLGFLHSFTLFLSPPLTDWQDIRQFEWLSFAYLVTNMAGFAIGWLFDFGADASPRRNWRLLRRFTLAIAGLIIAAFMLVRWRQGEVVFPLFSVLLAAGCCFWSWFPLNWFSKLHGRLPADVAAVTDLAHMRFGRMTSGRLLAVILCAVPVFMFLCSLGISQRVQWPESTAAIITTNQQQEPIAWYSRDEGRYLTEDDLAKYDVYHDGYLDFLDHENVWEKARANIETLKNETYGSRAKAAFHDLQQIWRQHNARIQTQQEFAAAIAKHDDYGLYRLTSVQSAPTLADPQGHTLYVLEFMRMTPMRKEQTQRFTGRTWFYALPFFTLAALSGFVLWRRGGDSLIAIGLGVWLIGATTTMNIVMEDYYYAAIVHEFWVQAIAGSRLAALMLGLLQAGFSLTAWLLFAHLLETAWVALWVAHCWPSGSGMAGSLIALGKFVLVWVLVNILRFIIWGIIALGQYFFLMVVWNIEKLPQEYVFRGMGYSSLAVSFAMVLLGALVLSRSQAAKRKSVALLTWKSAAAFVCLQISMFLFLPLHFLDRNHAGVDYFHVSEMVAGAIFLIGFIVFAGAAVLRDNYLRLSVVRSLSVLSALFVLPFAYELIETFVSWLLSLTGGILQSDQGIAVATIVLMVAVFAPLWSYIDSWFRAVAAPQLAQVERSTESLLEQLADHKSEPETQAALFDFFAQLKIERFAFYARDQRNVFRKTLVQDVDAAQDVLFVSQRLATFLKTDQQFIDLSDTSFQWRYFFEQFELHRLANHTACQYLLPICLGSSLRGLLLLPDGVVQPGSEVEPFSEQMANVGLAAIER